MCVFLSTLLGRAQFRLDYTDRFKFIVRITEVDPFRHILDLSTKIMNAFHYVFWKLIFRQVYFLNDRFEYSIGNLTDFFLWLKKECEVIREGIHHILLNNLILKSISDHLEPWVYCRSYKSHYKPIRWVQTIARYLQRSLFWFLFFWGVPCFIFLCTVYTFIDSAKRVSAFWYLVERIETVDWIYVSTCKIYAQVYTFKSNEISMMDFIFRIKSHVLPFCYSSNGN